MILFYCFCEINICKEVRVKFESFEQALQVCVGAEEGSREQVEAMIYCLENAPSELREILKERFKGGSHAEECGCGCKTPDA